MAFEKKRVTQTAVDDMAHCCNREKNNLQNPIGKLRTKDPIRTQPDMEF